MINIRPVSDLRNKYTEIEEVVINSNSPVFLTKNGYGTMVLMSVEQYCDLTDNVEKKLNEADDYAENSNQRLTATEVFGNVRNRIYE